jgi:hypothetical protein
MVEKLLPVYAVTQPINRHYMVHASLIKTTTVEIRDPIILKHHIDNGFLFIRRLHYNYNHILRGPTNGCNVELTKIQDWGSILIDSPAGRRLIKRICYF